MTYEQTIDFLLRRLPMFSRIGPAAFKKDLTNIKKLCEALDNPHKKFKSVHIGGTNGKGSVSHMLAAVLQLNGYRTGLYTSPHLKDFRERIRVNGELVREGFVVSFTEKIRPLIGQIEPSFFEISVAMAFDYFADENVDIAVVEVGLGGRFDSTNILTPELSVITQIGRDHMNMLGDTLAEIAYEKAGIIKYRTPVVVGETHPETKPVFEKKAEETEAPLFFADQLRYAAEWKYENHLLWVDIFAGLTGERKEYKLDLTGYYQVKNLVTLLESIHQLRQLGWILDDKEVHLALCQVKKLTGLHGRWEKVHNRPAIILDVGHNEDGIRSVAGQLELTDYHQLHIIFGMVRDKEMEKVLALLPSGASYYFTRADIPRAIPEEILLEAGNRLGRKGRAYPNVNQALQEAFRQSTPEDLILVCGSVFVVGEVDLSVLETAG